MFSNSWFRSPLDILEDGFDIVSNAIGDAVDTVQEFASDVAETVQDITENVTMMDVIKYGPMLPLTALNHGIDALDTNGYYKVFRHTVTDDLIGEGIPAFVGLIGDVGHGLGESAWGGVTRWDWKNPFYRVTRSDSYAAKMGRWGSENIGQPLSELYNAGDVHFKQAGEGEEGGVKGWRYTVDGEAYQPVDGGIATMKIVGNVADVVIPGTLLMKSRHLRMASKVAGGMAISSLGEVGWDMIDHGDAARLMDLLNDPDALDSKRGIRVLQRRLNDVNKPRINQSIDTISEQKRFVREGRITGDEAEEILDKEPLEFLNDDGELYTMNDNGSLNESVAFAMEWAGDTLTDGQRDLIAEKAENVSFYLTGLDTVEAYQGVLQLEQKFYNLAEQYVESPETFNPTQSEILTMQMWLGGAGRRIITQYGLEGREELSGHMDKYLSAEAVKWRENNPVDVPPREGNQSGGISSDVNVTGSFSNSAEGNITIQEFLTEKQVQIGTNLAVTQNKIDDLYMQKYESQQYMPVM